MEFHPPFPRSCVVDRSIAPSLSISFLLPSLPPASPAPVDADSRSHGPRRVHEPTVRHSARVPRHRVQHVTHPRTTPTGRGRSPMAGQRHHTAMAGFPKGARFMEGRPTGHRPSKADGGKYQWADRKQRSLWCLDPRTRHEGPWRRGGSQGQRRKRPLCNRKARRRSLQIRQNPATKPRAAERG
jgi:hypothetical protein